MWTLRYDTVEKSLKDWGLSNPVRNLISQGVDTFTVRQSGGLVDGAPLFPYGADIQVFRDGVQFFAGRRIRNSRRGQRLGEEMDYTFAGPWWFLDQIVYQQVWYRQVDPTSEAASLVGGHTSHVLLNQGFNGAKLTTEGQIKEALEYAISRGAPVRIANNYPALSVPIDEQVDITVGEVLRKMLRWIPDAVTWLDYATVPPTLHIARRGALDAVTLDLNAGNLIDGIQIEAREDLVRPIVHLKYEQVVTRNGQSWLNIVDDIAPSGADGYALGAFVATINLQGPSATIAEATIETEPIGALSSDEQKRAEWWLKKQPWLINNNIDLVSVSMGEMAGGYAFANELVGGQLADWMGIASREVIVKATVSYKTFEYVNGNMANRQQVGECVDEEFNTTITVTDAQSGTYRSIVAADSGDPVPEGLAKALYDALSVVQYDGQISVVEAEVSGSISIGQVLNLVGGRPEWANMRALIQQVSEDWGTGTTTVVFGPAEHLGPQDLVELLRVNRNRFIYTAPSTRDSGQASGHTVKLGTKFAGANSTAGGGVERFKRIQDRSDYIEFDPRTRRIKIHEQRTTANALDGFDVTLDREGLRIVKQTGAQMHLAWPVGHETAELEVFRVTLNTPDGPKSFLMFGQELA